MVKLKPKSYKIRYGDQNKDQRLGSILFNLKLNIILKDIGVILVLCLTILASMPVFGNWVDFLGDGLLEQDLSILLHMLCLKYFHVRYINIIK